MKNPYWLVRVDCGLIHGSREMMSGEEAYKRNEWLKVHSRALQWLDAWQLESVRV